METLKCHSQIGKGTIFLLTILNKNVTICPYFYGIFILHEKKCLIFLKRVVFFVKSSKIEMEKTFLRAICFELFHNSTENGKYIIQIYIT